MNMLFFNNNHTTNFGDSDGWPNNNNNNRNRYSSDDLNNSQNCSNNNGITTTSTLYKLNMNEMRKTLSNSKQATDNLFTNFEDVRLTDEERVYLNAAAIGDIGIIRMSLEESDSSPEFNVNCVDYMGRNALHLAVDFENTDAIEMLLDKLNFECIEEALLHAISKNSTKIVRIIIEHPNYMAGEDKIKKIDSKKAFYRTTEKSQFSPDITPLILSAHYNNHEIVQMFLSRNHSIDKPHPISCQCSDCQVRQDYDSLKRSRSRLNAYRALASPAFMALSSPDPIMTTFELRQEMMKLAEMEKEFKREYLMLVEQCMNFACEMMDLCRGTQEVEAVISDFIEEGQKIRDPLGRLRLAIRFEEKKFVAHPNCQQYLTSIWYGSQTAFLQSWSLFRKASLTLLSTPLLPILCLLYIVLPSSKLAKAMRCPAAKFATHGLSHMVFLILLAAATFRLEENAEDDEETSKEPKLFRTAGESMTHVQKGIVIWIAGLFLSELKHVYFSGLRSYISNMYNIVSFTILSLYISSYTLRILIIHFINSPTSHLEKSSDRFQWSGDDPEIVADVLFAVANVISFARTTYLMPAFEVLGPLQISFTKMLTDIVRFMVLYGLVLFAFMVGLHNLYWYYSIHSATEMFGGLSSTLYSLFWAMFGHSSPEKVGIKVPLKNQNSSVVVVDKAGTVLFAVYHGIIIIVLINMLIAMMSHSFETIQEDCDVEWKFARTKLWLNYIDNGSTLPVPFNLLPTPHSVVNAGKFIKKFFSNDAIFYNGNPRSTDFVKYRRDKVCQEKDLEFREASYAEIMQRLVRRYLFKMERSSENNEDLPLNSGNQSTKFSITDNLIPSADETTPPMKEKNQCSRRVRKTSSKGGGITRRGSSIFPSGGQAANGPVNINLPQLDSIQRSQKIVDLRLQNLQAQSDQLNAASGNARIKEEIEHVRVIMNENSKVLSSIIRALAQMQDQVGMLNNNMEQLVIAHASGQQIKSVRIEEKKSKRHSNKHDSNHPSLLSPEHNTNTSSSSTSKNFFTNTKDSLQKI